LQRYDGLTTGTDRHFNEASFPDWRILRPPNVAIRLHADDAAELADISGIDGVPSGLHGAPA
jgi:hypothetical protein